MKKYLLTGLAVSMLVVTAICLYFFCTYQEKKPVRISGALKALNLWGLQRAYPNNNIPDIGHYTAFQQVRQQAKHSLNKSTNVTPWEAIGPRNMGGRTLALEFNPLNPNTIYAGSASGGLWRSYTGGVGAYAWEYVPTGFPVLAVSAIAIAPDDSNVIYLGTGEVYNYQTATMGAAFRWARGTYGIGILKTTDGGLTWSKCLDWSLHQQRGVWAIKINPFNSKTVFATTTEGTYKSTDAGATWTRVHDVIMANDLVFGATDTNIVVVACGNFGSDGHGIYRSTDGGATWNKCTRGLPETFFGKAHLDVYRGKDFQIMLASIGNGFNVNSPDNATWLCDSYDDGATWGIASTEDYSQWQGWFSHDIAVHPTDFTQVMAVGINIYKSTLSGGMPELKSTGGPYPGQNPPGAPEGTPTYSHVDHHEVKYHPTNPNIIYFGNDGGVFRSTDGGETFAGCNGGYQTVQFYNGFSCSHQDSNFAMGGLQDNGTVLYLGSDAWFLHVLGGDGSWTAIDVANDHNIFASWQGLNILKSTDQLQTGWQRQVTPPLANRPTCFIAPYILGIDNPEVMYAGRDIVFKSVNGGLNWTATNGNTPLDGNPVFSLAISQQNSDVVFAATAAVVPPFTTRPGVFRTINGGQSWDNITGTLPDRFPGEVAVDPTDDAIVYVAVSGFGSSHLFKSIDSGDNWQDIGQGLPDVPTSAVVIDPEYPQNIYVGNDLGVWVSTDAGNSWYEFSEGLPEAVIAMDLAISPVNRKLRVATHGNGAYQRKLLGHVPVAVAENETVPAIFKLEQNYPNPFNPTTQISYSLSQPSRVTLKIYNSIGQEVQTLVDNQVQNAGKHYVNWNGTDNTGLQVAAGTYLYRLQAGDQVQSKKMNLTR